MIFKYRSIIVSSILIVISLVVFSFHVRHPSSSSFLRKLAVETITHTESLLRYPLDSVKDVWKRYIFLVNLGEENKRLEEKNALLARQLIQYKEAYFENIRLQKLLALKENVSCKSIAAKVIAKNQVQVLKTILINKGTAHGLKVNLPVVTDQGIVGRIIETSWLVSRVLLLTDESSNIDVIVQRNRMPGILQGAGFGGCYLKYVSKTEDIKIGDILISSGMGGIFPKGLLIGTVTGVNKTESGLFQKIDVKLSADVAKIEEVLIFIPENNNGRQ
jgi:rod shape-determining protein MreC